MTTNIKTIVDAFTAKTDYVDYNLADHINKLQSALDALAYMTFTQAGFAETETLSGNKTLTDDSAVLQFLNPNTADRDVNLPAVAATNHPTLVMNTNGSTYLLTVKNSGGTVIRVVPAGKGYWFVSDGNQWICVSFDLYKTISPLQITASQNNYNPTGAYEADILRLDSDAAYNITGLAGGSTNRIKIIHNIGSYTLTLKNADASSTDVNRFELDADFELESKKSVMVIYDGISQRWRVLGGGGAGGSGGLTISSASVTASNVTGVEGTLHNLGISGMTANRDFVFPTPSAADQFIGVRISTGDDTYALVLKINGTEYTRLFITNEVMIFRSTGTGAGDWVPEIDGRIPCIGLMTRTSSNTNTTHSAATEVKPDWNTAPTDENTGDIADLTNDYFVIRRAGIVFPVGGFAPANNIADQKFAQVRIYKNSTLVASSNARQSSASAAGLFTATTMKPVKVAVGDTLTYYFRTEEANIGLKRSDPGDGSDGQSFFAVMEYFGGAGGVGGGGGSGDALTSNPLSQFAATTSAQLAGVISDETGSGALVFATSPTLVTPALGTPSALTLTNATGLPTAGLVDDAVTLAKLVNATAQYRLLGRSSSGAGNFEEIASSANVFSILTAADYAAIRTLLDLVIGTNVQAYDADLTTWAGLTPSANAQSLVTAADYAAMLALLLNVPLPENTAIQLDAVLSADGKYSGIVLPSQTAGATLAFGDLVYLSAADSRWELTDADAEATAGPVMLGICVLAAAGDGSATTILVHGKIRADTAFPTMTVSAPLFVSTTAGDIQTTAPSGTADIIRIVGHALTADELFFNPSPDYFEHS